MPEGVKQRSMRGLVVQQVARDERANIMLAYVFLARRSGYNQKLFH